MQKALEVLASYDPSMFVEIVENEFVDVVEDIAKAVFGSKLIN